MLVQIKGSEKIQADAVFFQPTRYCGMNCKGCYVKAHTETLQMPCTEQTSLLGRLCRDHDIGQITMSVDTLPGVNTPGALPRRAHLGALFQEFLYLANILPSRPELHITVHSAGVLRDYIETLKIDDTELERLDFISLSHPPTMRRHGFRNLTKRLENTQFGWNVKIPSKMDKNSILTGLRWIDEAQAYLDQIYLMLTKSPVGAKRTLQTAEIDKQQMRTDLHFIEQVYEMAERNGYRHKLLVDGCLRDVVKFKDTGYGCSANISKFQIWPDGSVSGCPYKYKAVTPHAGTWEEVLINIRKAQYYYDFQECHLPEIYADVTRIL